MSDFNDNSFKDKNIIKTVQKILSWQTFTPISEIETKIYKRRNEISELNNKMHHRLILYLNKMLNLTSPSDVLLFLLVSMRDERLEQAIQALDIIIERDTPVKGFLLKKALKDDMPLTWSILLTDVTEERYKAKSTNVPTKNSLNMDELRNKIK